MGTLDENGLLIPDSIIDVPFGVHELVNNTATTDCLGPGDEKNIDPRHEILTKVLPKVCNKKFQKGAECIGPVFGPSWVCRSCWCNFHNSLCNRHAKIAPVITSFFPLAYEMLDHFRPMVGVEYNRNWEYWQKHWLEKWPKRKQLAIEKSRKEELLRFGSVKSFTKREPGHRKVKKSRAIQGYRNFVTQAYLGPSIYALQKACGSVFDFRRGRHRFGNVGITIASGLNALDLGEWMQMVHTRYGKPVFYERDGSNWDATMQAGHQDLVNVIYDCMEDEIYAAIQMCREVHGFSLSKGEFDVIIRYVLKETTKSGHNDTSLRNSIINACIAYEAFRSQHIDCELIVMGDDLLVAAGQRIDAPKMIHLESTMGIIPEAGVMDDYTKVTFISGRWIRTKTGFIFCPLLGRLLLRLYWTSKNVDPKKMASFKYSIAMGLKPAVGAFPIYDALLSCKKEKLMDTGKFMETWDCVQHYDEGVMQHLCDRYTTIPQEIEDLCNVIRANIDTPCLIKHPLADRIIEVDLRPVERRG